MPYARKKFRASMRICSWPSGNRVHIRWGNDLTNGLKEFYSEFLKGREFKIVSCEGNVLIVKQDNSETTYEFRAYLEPEPKS
jgi:hypothetical protein